MNQSFHERFDINLPIEEVKNRFCNRINVLIFNQYTGFMENYIYLPIQPKILGDVISALGMPFQGGSIGTYTGTDFHLCIHALEALYKSIGRQEDFQGLITLEKLILRCLEDSEVDLGIRWESGVFYQVGAGELDEVLVNQPLKWLRDNRYETVLVPYEKSLSDFLNLDRSPEHLGDVITDAYEAIEALAKIVCDRDRDLSKNAELFINKIKASIEYKAILKEYISYANNFRHAVKEGGSKPQLKLSEVESFVYLTGIMIRLVILSESEN